MLMTDYLRKRAIRPVKNEPRPSKLSSGSGEAVCGRFPFAWPAALALLLAAAFWSAGAALFDWALAAD